MRMCEFLARVVGRFYHCCKLLLKKDSLIKVSIILVFSLFSLTSYADDKVLNVYNWSNYIPDSVLAEFTKETGIRVNYSTYDSNEALYAKLKSNPKAGYDIVVPTSYFVQRMIEEKMLLPIDKSQLNNLKYLNPKLLNLPHDPHNRYSVPYLWGVTSLVVNSKYYDPKTVTSWQDLWQPRFKNQVVLIDDVRDTFGMALKVLGYSVNDKNPQHIEQAYEKLKALLPNTKVFFADSTRAIYLDEDGVVGMMQNGDGFVVSQENPNIHYTFPKEGAMMWMDNMVIPKGAAHVNNAYIFMNFILRPDIAEQISTQEGFSSPNLAAIKLMPAALRNNPVLNPTSADLKNAEEETYIEMPIYRIYLKYWELLKLGG